MKGRRLDSKRSSLMPPSSIALSTLSVPVEQSQIDLDPVFDDSGCAGLMCLLDELLSTSNDSLPCLLEELVNSLSLQSIVPSDIAKLP
jgi:hypothetical protein